MTEEKHVAGKKRDVVEVSVDDVARRLAAGESVLLDANPLRRYRKGHLPGAIPVDPAAVGDSLPADQSAPLVFYCRDRGCGAAPAAARRAMALGYQNVVVMPEGIVGWEESGHPVDTVSSGSAP